MSRNEDQQVEMTIHLSLVICLKMTCVDCVRCQDGGELGEEGRTVTRRRWWRLGGSRAAGGVGAVGAIAAEVLCLDPMPLAQVRSLRENSSSG